MCKNIEFEFFAPKIPFKITYHVISLTILYSTINLYVVKWYFLCISEILCYRQNKITSRTFCYTTNKIRLKVQNVLFTHQISLRERNVFFSNYIDICTIFCYLFPWEIKLFSWTNLIYNHNFPSFSKFSQGGFCYLKCSILTAWFIR